jgi:hypothetical protein
VLRELTELPVLLGPPDDALGLILRLPRHIVGAGVEIVIIQQPDDDL